MSQTDLDLNLDSIIIIASCGNLVKFLHLSDLFFLPLENANTTIYHARLLRRLNEILSMKYQVGRQRSGNVTSFYILS